MRRWLWGGAAVIVVVFGFVALPYARFAYLWHFYGPSALERMADSPPISTLHYGPATKQYAELPLPLPLPLPRQRE